MTEFNLTRGRKKLEEEKTVTDNVIGERAKRRERERDTIGTIIELH